MVRKYRKIISSIFYVSVQSAKTVFQIEHGCCRFYPSCAEFAREAIQKHSITKALPMILKRIIKCQPFVPGGVYPVPEEVVRLKGRGKRE
jgi:putative membrane protein insertion efficiency factor